MRTLLRCLPLLLFLAGCATTPPPAPTPAPPPRAKEQPDESPEAARAYQRGDYVTAAILYARAAARRQPPLRQEYQLNAAEALVRAEKLNQAAQLLARVNTAGMAPRDHTRLQLLQARIALKQRDADQALAILAGPRAPAVDPALQAEFHLLRAYAYGQTANHIEAAREYVAREPLLSDPKLLLGNQQGIWDALNNLSEAMLLAMQSAPPPDTLSGWMELARIAKSRHTATELEGLLARWRVSYPAHPVRDEILATVRARAEQITELPSRLALLLPLSGSFKDAAAAVRDGVMAAHYASATRAGVRIRAYDTGPDPAGVVAAYEQAVREGAQFVIGPLRKEEVELLGGRGDLPVPVLALNNLDATPASRNLYQFGLSPEDEARQVADRVWLDGHTRAAIVAPEGAWGTRIAEAFAERWRQHRGVVVESVHYNPQENDFSTPLRSLLDLDESDRRHLQLEHLLGRSLEFVPRRRKDIDFIFLAAFPRPARLLRPQLTFHHAGDLPVYSTSHLFTGTVAAEQDRDMDGTLFGDMPWVLEGLQPPSLKRHDGQLRRLVALGLDAYNLLPYLQLLDNYPDQHYAGGTGILFLDEGRRIQRQLAWARFTNGRPRPLELVAPVPERE